MWRMLCKLVTLCGFCEGACYMQVINMTPQMPVPVGQMDSKAEWLHVWGTRQLNDGWGGVTGKKGEAEALLWQTSLNISNRGAWIPGARSPGRLNSVLWPPITAISFLSSSRKHQITVRFMRHYRTVDPRDGTWPVTIMAPRIWRWLLKVQKICVPLYQKHKNNALVINADCNYKIND